MERFKNVFQLLTNESSKTSRESDYRVQTCGENPEGVKAAGKSVQMSKM